MLAVRRTEQIDKVVKRFGKILHIQCGDVEENLDRTADCEILEQKLLSLNLFYN